jgi:hypothetical protein
MSRIAMVAGIMFLAVAAIGAERRVWIPKGGFVPDSQTAILFAEGVPRD